MTKTEHEDDLILLYPILEESGRCVTLKIDRELSVGEWQLEIPEGFFEIQPNFVEVEEMPFSQEEMLELNPCGAWHKQGGEWINNPMFSIHDDDGVDGKIPSCGTTHIPERNGYFTILYPLLKSLGVHGNVSVEGWRCGMLADPPAINDNGRILYRLEKEAGWEIQAHSIEVLGGRNNNWYVDSLDSPLADKILAEAVGYGQESSTTSIYVADAGKQYYPSNDRTHWIEADSLRIKPYALDYNTGRPKLYIKDHNVAYHWGEWFRLAKEWGFRATAWVQHNAITSHDYAKEINKYGPYGFSDMVVPYQYNVVPMRSTATRMMMEGQSAPGYIGEMSDDNTYDHEQLKWFCNYIDRCESDKGWIVLGLHAYRKCWKNYLPGSLVSEGGNYPDEWVNPLEGMDFLNDPLDTPPARLGISSWDEWYPCPGTRLDMLRDIILYCLDKGFDNVTSSEGFERIGNRRMVGYFNNGVRCGFDRYFLEDDREVYPHYIESATGEESYYRPLITDSITHTFAIVDSANTDLPTEDDPTEGSSEVRPLPFNEVSIPFGQYATIDGTDIYDPGVYFSDDENHIRMATRLSVTPPDENTTITQPYLYWATPTSVYMGWKTSSDRKEQHVRFGTSPENLFYEISPIVRSLTNTYYWNVAELTGLIPDTPYFYQVISDGEESEIYRFHTPAEYHANEKQRILIIGDHQRNERSDYEWLLQAAHQKLREKYGDQPIEDLVSFILNTGNQVDSGFIHLYEKVHLFKSRSVSSFLPIMTAVGNHEFLNDPELKLYDGHFHEYAVANYNDISSGDPTYYAYQNGSVLFIILNSERPSIEQKLWLRKVMAEADADDDVKFIVSLQHTPLYAEQWKTDVSPWMRDIIMPIISSSPKHFLNIAGHHHLYTRGQLTDYPVYHMISGGGVGTSAAGYEQLWGMTPNNENIPEVQKTIDQWTYQILEFDPQASTMNVESYSIGNARFALDNTLIDRFSRKLNSDSILQAPRIGIPSDTLLTLPCSLKIAEIADSIHSVEYQISTDSTFGNILYRRLNLFEDYYDVKPDYTPLDKNKGIDLSSIEIPANILNSGIFFIRARQRNMNLDWSDYSEPAAFSIADDEKKTPSIQLSQKLYPRNSEIYIEYFSLPEELETYIRIDRLHDADEDEIEDGLYQSVSIKPLSTSGKESFRIDMGGKFYAVIIDEATGEELSDRIIFYVSETEEDDYYPVLTTNKSVYDDNEPINFILSNPLHLKGDCIEIYRINEFVIDGIEQIARIPITYSSEDENIYFNPDEPLTPGTYYARYLTGNFHEPMGLSNKFIVGKPVILESVKSLYEYDEEIRLAYEGMTDFNRMRIVVMHDDESVVELYPENEGGVISAGVFEPGEYTAVVRTSDDNNISSDVYLSVDDNGTSTDIRLISTDKNLMSNRHIRKHGIIEVYTITGQLYMRSTDEVTIPDPGLYIVRNNGRTDKIFIR